MAVCSRKEYACIEVLSRRDIYDACEVTHAINNATVAYEAATGCYKKRRWVIKAIVRTDEIWPNGDEGGNIASEFDGGGVEGGVRVSKKNFI